MIFTSEKLDKSDELLDVVNNLTINNDGYYESNTATTSYTQGDLTHNIEIGNHTSNRNFEQILLSYRITPVLPSPKNPWIDQEISEIKLTPQTLLTPATKVIVTDAASGGAWMFSTLRQASRTGVNGRIPWNIGNAIGIVEPSYPVMIGIIGTTPPCGLNIRQEVWNKRQATFPGLVRQSQKLNAVVDRKLTNNLDSKLSNCSRRDLYTRFSMNFAADTVQTQTPQFVDLRISTINTFDEGSGLSTHTTKTWRPTDDANWSAPYNIFGETTVVGVSETKYD